MVSIPLYMYRPYNPLILRVRVMTLVSQNVCFPNSICWITLFSEIIFFVSTHSQSNCLFEQITIIKRKRMNNIRSHKWLFHRFHLIVCFDRRCTYHSVLLFNIVVILNLFLVRRRFIISFSRHRNIFYSNEKELRYTPTTTTTEWKQQRAVEQNIIINLETYNPFSFTFIFYPT